MASGFRYKDSPTFDSLEGLFQWLCQNPNYANDFLSEAKGSNDQIFQRFGAALEYYRALYNYQTTGQGNPNDIYGLYGNVSDFVKMSPETEKYLDNAIAQGNAQTERDFQEYMRNTSITSTGSQLQGLGLSPSNVISVGGASSGVSTNAAATDMHSPYATRQQERINEYNQKMGLAKSIIGMTGALAASGIYGHSLLAAKKAAASMSTAASHSGLKLIRHLDEYQY